jgi:hypothetical protein
MIGLLNMFTVQYLLLIFFLSVSGPRELSALTTQAMAGPMFELKNEKN